ncbi:Zn-ribbon domain-containing OB-fold protein [Chloroflexota bacterium]
MSTMYNSEYSIPLPAKYLDNMGFWEGVQKRELVFQRCKQCGIWLHPPRPMCPKCHSMEKEWAPSKGRGTIYSFVTYRESPYPGFRAPYSVVLVELEEGVRLVSNMVDCTPEDLHIGMPVEVVFEDLAENLTLPKFKKA